MSYALFYVLNGLQNGEEGVYATTTGFGHQLRDGHYFLLDDATDGVGPFPSRDAARRVSRRPQSVHPTTGRRRTRGRLVLNRSLRRSGRGPRASLVLGGAD